MPVTPEGLVTPTIEEIQDDIVQDTLAEVDPALDLSPNQPLGQVFGIFAAKLEAAYELLTVAANADNPDANEGFFLESTCAITGTTRQAATRSKVTATCNLNSGFTAAAHTMFANVDGYPDLVFRNVSAVGPIAVTGDESVDFEAVTAGPTVANAGTLTVIKEPLSGWNSVTNADDAIPGLAEDTDEDLRARRVDELTSGGSSTAEAIRADVLKIPKVQQCYVFENNSNDTDADGVPARAFEVLVYDGLSPEADDDAIRAAIWANKVTGGNTYGSTSGTVYDSGGDPRIVKFTRASLVPIYFGYTITRDLTKWPANGDALVKAAAAAKALAVQNLGVDVIALAYRAAALTVPGVVDVTDFRLGKLSSPTGIANVAISSREIATVDTAHVTVAYA